LYSMDIPPIGESRGVGTNNSWILVESSFKW
jgi:hypothetical protein